MNITVVGTGYVGLVTGTCLSDIGHNVTCVDVDESKIKMLRSGKSPIYEEGIEAIIEKNIHAERLHFTTSLKDVLPKSEVVIIAVGTPSDKEGKADLQYVKAVATEIGQHLDHEIIVVDKSTVPVGTAQMVEGIIKKQYNGSVEVVSCPEFLREGTAVADFFQPDRIVVGTRTKKAADIMNNVFEPIKCPKVNTTVESAEMIKYASNAFLATKISFINEIANICERVGADIEEVAYGMGLDSRIGKKFLRAGLGYGGSCFPKDVRALSQIAGTNGYDFQLLKGVIAVNNDQRKFLVQKIDKALGGIHGKKVAILGLAFKDNTDDVRESAALDIIPMLQKAGVESIDAYDPEATENALKVVSSINTYTDPYAMIEGNDIVVIATEWREFKNLDWKKIKSLMKQPIVIDGRNLLDKKYMEDLGFTYTGIGRTNGKGSASLSKKSNPKK